jgi:hypothetical protein
MSERLQRAEPLSYAGLPSPGTRTWFGWAGCSFCAAVAAAAAVFFSAVALEDALVRLFDDFGTGEAASIWFAVVVGGLSALFSLVTGAMSLLSTTRWRGPGGFAVLGMTLGMLVLVWCVMAAVS